MTEILLKILLVEDNDDYAVLLGEMLHAQVPHSIDVTWVRSMAEARRHLADHTVDVVVLDLGLPDAQGLEAVRWTRAAAPATPMVVLTASDDESLAVQALKEGAQDYFVKGKVETSTLYRAMLYAIERKTLEEELRRAKIRAEQAEALLRDAVDSMSEGFVIFDRDDRFVMCNEAYRRLYRGSTDCLVPGVDFETYLRCEVAAGTIFDARGREAEWLAERLRIHREASGSFECRLREELWLVGTDRRMSNGGTAGLRIDISALKQAQAALRESEASLHRAQEIANVGSWEYDIATRELVWSRHLRRVAGLPPDIEPTLEEVTGQVHPADIAALTEWRTDLRAGRQRDPIEIRSRRPDGKERVHVIEARLVADSDGVVRRIAGTVQDITERRAIERALAQSQKMEALGQLTGGMAHDFNNMLGIIIGNLDLMKPALRGDALASELCVEALDGAARCADLIRRLLAFARHQPLHPDQIDVNVLIGDLSHMLGRTLGEHIVLTLELDAAVRPVKVDSAQLMAALVNMATNARDAMPKGGQLTISTRNVTLDAAYAAQHDDVSAGDYAAIEIRDTGTGIPREIVNRIFEPFFTTKASGQGTGLGLSMVFGFVKQSGGHLTVYSEVGQGSCFRLYLPCYDNGVAATPSTTRATQVVGGNETVLVVEDNAQLRQVAMRQLTTLGYKLREADGALPALEILSSTERVDLLFTDVVMPGPMDGLDLAYAATRMRPGLRVLLTSGFPCVRSADRRVASCPFHLLGKPYSLIELAQAVRSELNDADHAGRRTNGGPVAAAPEGTEPS